MRPPGQPSNTYLVLASLILTGLIVAGAFVVLQPFLLAVIWAGVIAMTSWPMHEMILRKVGGRPVVAASLSTVVITLTLVVPTLFLLYFVVTELYTFANYIIEYGRKGVPAPAWVERIPVFGHTLAKRWNEYIGTARAITQQLQDLVVTKLSYIQDFAQLVLAEALGRVATLLFALWILYFIYRDGKALTAQINQAGFKWLPRRWTAYAYNIPTAVRSTVNGVVIVSLAEVVLISGLLAVFDVPSPVLLGMLTTMLAFIPLAAPVCLAVIALLLYSQDMAWAGIVILTVGTSIIMVADYIIRPLLIRGSTELPFLAVLFGIMGGVASMGVLGLIIGPVILVLFAVLLREATLNERADLEF